MILLSILNDLNDMVATDFGKIQRSPRQAHILVIEPSADLVSGAARVSHFLDAKDQAGLCITRVGPGFLGTRA